MNQAAAQGSAYQRFLDKLPGHVQTRGDREASAQCPAHDDRNDSLSITRRDDGAVLINCHAGCDSRDVVAAMGLTMKDLFDTPRDRENGYSVVAEYPYRDENGDVLYVKERRFPKDFRQYRPLPGGRRAYSLGDVRRVLYRLPELVASAEVDATVYVCEGEKDADRVRAVGATATTWGDGAWREGQQSKWRREYTETLRGRGVVIVADDDAPGRATAVVIAKELEGAARSVSVVIPAAGKDAHDHLEAGHTLGDFRPLVPAPRQSPEATTTAAPADGTTFLGMREEHHGQLRMAYRFTRMHDGRMMHVHGLGWHYWDGHRWQLDENGAADRAVVEVLRESLREIAHVETEARKPLLRDVTKSETAGGIAGVLRIAQSLDGMTCTVKELDADPWILNTPDGTVDLRAGTLSPADPKDRITKVTTVGFGANQDAPVFRAFMERILPDLEVRQFVQRLLGYSLLGEVTEHVLPIWVGDGANGKGTLRDLIRHVVGDYGIEVDPSILMAGPEKHSTERMDLLGARFVACSETARGAGLNEAVMKRLVGGDPIRARRMRQDNVEFEPSHTLVMMTNHLPKVSGDDGGVWRRILVVPFDVVIPEAERDSRLRDKLRAEAPAVMSWLWDGWVAYQAQGLNPPDSVRARTTQYQQDSDALGRFLDDRCLSGPHFHVPARDLYTEFIRWCTDTGEQYGSEKEFAEQMRRKGVGKRHTRTGNVYGGIALAADDDQADDEPPQEPEQTRFM